MKIALEADERGALAVAQFFAGKTLTLEFATRPAVMT
jgi:hypothetical protein